MARLMDRYKKVVIKELVEEFKFKNLHQVPRLTKIVVNMGVGSAVQEKQDVENAAKDLAVITGQKPLICRSKKSISNFNKLREGQAIGCKVTMRGVRMYEFLDRLVSVVIPRIRDFRGLPVHSFDKQGNYSFGITEQTIFPEIDLDKVKKVQGMDVTFVTTGRNVQESKALLRALGVPFKRESTVAPKAK